MTKRISRNSPYLAGHVRCIEAYMKIVGGSFTDRRDELINSAITGKPITVMYNEEPMLLNDFLDRHIEETLSKARKFISINVKMFIETAQEINETFEDFIRNTEYLSLVQMMEYRAPEKLEEFSQFLTNVYDISKNEFYLNEKRVINAIYDTDYSLRFGNAHIDVFHINYIQSGLELKNLVQLLERKYGLSLNDYDDGVCTNIKVLKALIEDEISAFPMLLTNRSIQKRISTE